MVCYSACVSRVYGQGIEHERKFGKKAVLLPLSPAASPLLPRSLLLLPSCCPSPAAPLLPSLSCFASDYYTRRVRVRGRWGGRCRQGPMTQGAARAGGRGGGAAGKGPMGQGGGRRQGRTTRSRQGRRGESGAVRRRDGAGGAAGRATRGQREKRERRAKGRARAGTRLPPKRRPPPRAGPAPALRGVAAAP